MQFARDLNLDRWDSGVPPLAASRRPETSGFIPFERPTSDVISTGNETTEPIESDSARQYRPSGIAPEISELQRAVRENPQNLDCAHRLFQMFVSHGLLDEMQDFWNMMMARYPRSELPAEQLLATLELKGHTNRIQEIVPSLCSIFPSSRIPKNQYLALKSDSDERAEDFLIQHLREFPSESSLVECVVDEHDVPGSWRWGIWDKIFNTTDWSNQEGKQILANRIRDSCFRRGYTWDLLFMWGNLAGKWTGEFLKNFASTQQLWCHVELGNWDEFRRLNQSTFRWSPDSHKFKLGKRLALKGQWGLVVERNEQYPRHLQFLRGALDGFKEKGDIDGLVRVATKLRSRAQMREALQAMLNVLDSGAQGRTSLGGG